jgi:hypothetical protein
MIINLFKITIIAITTDFPQKLARKKSVPHESDTNLRVTVLL